MKTSLALLLTSLLLVFSLTACGRDRQPGDADDSSVSDGSVSGGVNDGSYDDSVTGGVNDGNGGGMMDDAMDTMDDVGDAVEDMWDGGRRAVDDVTRGTAGATSFQRMLDNARVTDVDGNMDGSASGRW